MSRPSMMRAVETGAPASFASVGSRSIVIAGSAPTAPLGMRPGQRAMNGTRTPPSNDVPLPSRNGPGDPAWLPYDSHGPLSEVKMTSVLSSRFARFDGIEDLPDRPVDLRDHVAVQPRLSSCP